MELERLEKYKGQFKNFSKVIDSFQSYLSGLNMSGNTMPIIEPYIVSKKLSIPESDAYFILSLAEKEHILHKKFKVWTNDNPTLLGDFDNSQSIPYEIINKDTGKKVARDDYYVDIVFELGK